MRKIIILLLCCGLLIGMVGCGGNTAPPPTESPSTTVSETAKTETPTETTPPETAIEPTEKEKEPTPIESKDQATEPTTTATEPTTTEKPKEETKPTTTQKPIGPSAAEKPKDNGCFTISRLGRNYIEVGNYTEILFPRWNVRYIAINDNYDSLYSEGNEFAPFKNLFNEWFARDTSKKIRAVVKAKAERGERVSTQIPYGYKKDTDIKGHLLIDEVTAPVVKMIFELCALGNGPRVIANILREKKILKPTVYRYRQSDSYGCITDTEDIYGWNDRTVAGILDNEVYLGHTINCKTTVASYKDKRKIDRPESEWLRFENTHEAIIAKVVIHERSDKWSKSAEQQIDIYFRYIGNLTVQPVEQAG